MKQRILTGVIAAAIFLPLVILGELPFTVLVYAMGILALFELLRMKGMKLLSVPGVISLLLLGILLYPNQLGEAVNLGISKGETVFLAVLLLLAFTVLSKNSFSFDEAAFVTLAAIYIGFGFYYFIEIRNIGLSYVFFAIGVVWSTDSGAYFIGKAFGKRKLWPEISPNKTVEGFWGGILTAVIFSAIYQAATGFPHAYLFVLLITVLLSIVGQIGDLAESAFKRHYQVKDSGRILPGHGGMLDRFDSFLFVMPVLYFLLVLFQPFGL
ncbi:phosphatidate cytidylyltransferase [Bacillus swezeyi]|uniref:Phosphatidate cytidylyltransferase n=1 Tax=Bacillus swezeyi TaxID=1925020 RepID=A0A1R1RZC4_9BACI|nr:phosphatidate cytidylyltransferase [Bacillus swezeyi]MEC1260899.1 phosphatidate cytidylyltransferase [Bacillus swezeyi]MED1741850.1 phosphatidate cytidylyltransferase [Bacillus swezeyi]MED2928836.1 phosphatidate cytidylyltransferase [Bacillus swezeyi]MED2943012.1 phosphatidate cytidylyltransferase [Bacillus swezeyi]MED2964358.1 phosphatidate cytidylyltransferase [Bacillus swezeyi]